MEEGEKRVREGDLCRSRALERKGEERRVRREIQRIEVELERLYGARREVHDEVALGLPGSDYRALGDELARLEGEIGRWEARWLEESGRLDGLAP